MFGDIVVGTGCVDVGREREREGGRRGGDEDIQRPGEW